MSLVKRSLARLRGAAVRPPGPPRLLAYCASNVGLGHYGRLLRVLAELRRRRPELSILLATDAPPTAQETALGISALRLPGFEFISGADFTERPRHLALACGELGRLRATLLESLAATFRPDLVLMDTNPHGKRDEMLPLLRTLRRTTAARTALLLRDIPCPPGEQFKLNGPAAQIERHARLYNKILIAGDAAFFDAAAEYAWPPALRAKAETIGFVTQPVHPAPRAETFAQHPGLDPALPLVVAGFGGGWRAEADAPRLLDGLAAYRASGRPAQLALALGPAAAPELLADLRARASTLSGVCIERWIPHFSQLLAHADLALLQAGSTVYQILETDIPILLMVRDYKSREQHARAERLARLPGVRMVQGAALEQEPIESWLAWGIGSPRAPRQTGFSFEGAPRAAAALEPLLPPA